MKTDELEKSDQTSSPDWHPAGCPRWYRFSLVAANGSAVGWGQVVANSSASAIRFATMFLAGTSTVRLDEETAR